MHPEKIPIERCVPQQSRLDIGRDVIKGVALLTMTVDHVGAILYPEYVGLRIIGRLAFPLFAYLLVLGVKSTRNVNNYLFRLGVFALISQIPFSLALGILPWQRLNIYFTLTAGVLALKWFTQKSELIVLPFLVATVLNFDYNFYGMFTIIFLQILYTNTKKGVLALLGLNVIVSQIMPTQVYSLLALPLILLHKIVSENPPRDTILQTPYPTWRKYSFYMYYPLHLTLLYLFSCRVLAV